ncbi:MAG: hypothetical protein ACKODH_11995 [Limisphaerales bacterium]
MIYGLRNWLVRVAALAGLLAFSGCSTFNRDWKAAVASPHPTNSIEGRWEGKWLSDHNGHTGGLRALIRKLDNGQYETRFHATYGVIFSFETQVKLDVRAADGQWQFSGAEDLGKPWGVYRYEGHASATNFLSTYKASLDHGTFRLARPAP